LATPVLLAAVVFSAVPVYAKPMVSLLLSGAIVTKDDKGQEQTKSMEKAVVTPGQTIRYSILVSNKGDQDARNVIPVGNIPNGTAYEAGSASQKNALRVEFSLNKGKTWSEHPTVTVHTPTGDVVKPADPATYTQVRWVAAKPLAPNGAVTYTYDVRVK
jgi:uncharacterized repeat protein (TIGR01451 family)